ncbi:DNA methyltransferase [Sphingomonas sp. ZT3P38]|uniref:DNA methyltransferase n=1 Tax=Parasphingomonas zepuensis TaxID=3096161 RepID=UPI002FC9D4A0
MTAPESYQAFLEAKVPLAQAMGLPCDLADVQTHRSDGQPLRDHQRACIRWGVEGGRRAYFLNFGLGKSTIQVETGRLVLEKVAAERQAAAGATAPIGLIVGPLGCRSDLIKDARLIGVEVRFVRDMEQVWAGYAEGVRMFLTNFETVRDGKIEVAAFSFASIDEAAALRDYGSDTFQTFVPLFASVPYRFVATAMPAPNRYKEMIHYAAFLGIMDSGQALTRFFQRNSEKAGDLTLYPHKEEEFWLWVMSWAVFLQKPSDLGFSDEGYTLPALDFRTHMVAADLGNAGEDRHGQGRLIKMAATGVIDTAREARDTIDVRVAKVAEIVAESPDDHFLLWHDLEDERHALRKAIPGVAEVFGSQKLDVNERIADAFAAGEHQWLAAKPSMLGAGRNFQYHCHRATIFPTYKFHDFLQALHRIYRFMQQHVVIIDLVYAETQSEQLRELMRKWDDHTAMVDRMSDLIRRYGLDHEAAAATMARSMGVAREVAEGVAWTAVHNDCVAETRTMEENSVDLIVTSIPFGNHYEYSARYEDFGHTDDSAHFFEQMDYLTPELLRVLRPGRMAYIHVKDRIRFAAVTGLARPTVDPFHAQTIEHFRRHGFIYAGLRFIATDVVRENNQTYRLTYKELRKDSTKMGCGSPEFLLQFYKLPTDRSKGYADMPVMRAEDEYSLARWQVDADSLWRSSGDRPLRPDELGMLTPGALKKAFPAWSVQDVYNHEEHVAIGEALAGRDELPRTFAVLQPATMRTDVWTDVARMMTLNGEQTRRGLENHICPLQFDIVDRAIRLGSNPGELVYDPFGGLMTVPVRAMKLGRRGLGVELNSDYWRDGVRYCRETEAERDTPSLFDLLDMEAAA